MLRFPPLLERLVLFALLCLLWSLAYMGVSAWCGDRAMQTIPWDPARWVPVVSAFVIPYLSAFAMPFLLLYALRDVDAYRRHALAIAFAITVSGASFLLLPLTIERPALSGASLFDPLLSALYASDRPTNLFPSLHVSLALLFAAGIAHARPRWKTFAWSWAALIALSTVFTGQHYVVDVLGGALVAWVAWRLFLKRSVQQV